MIAHRYLPENDQTFKESVVVQSSLGELTQEEVCAELALGPDDKGGAGFCVKCLETLTSSTGQTLKRYCPLSSKERRRPIL